MRWFYSHLNSLSLSLVFFLLIIFCPLYAEDIEIDLGGSSAPSSKSSPQTTEHKTPKITKAIEKKGADSKTSSEVSENVVEEVSPRSSSAVNQISVSSENGGAQISIDGENLSRPFIGKISARKILLKFLNTKLNIPSKINENNEIVKTIRSSTHSGKTAWIVLDVTTVKKWEIVKTNKGYLLVLNSGDGIRKNPEEVLNEKSSGNVEGGNSSEKRLFSRLIDVSLKPFEKGLKIVMTSDGSSKYTVRKLSQPEKLIIRFHDTKLEIADKVKKFNAENSEMQKGGLLLMELRQIGSSFSPISEAMLTLVPGTVHQIDHDLNQVVITLSSPPSQEKPTAKKGNLNQLVSLDIESADLNAVVKTLASEAGFDVDMVAGPLAGVVNEKFKDVPLKTALATLLSPGGYNFEVQGNTLRMGPQGNLLATKANLPHIIEIIGPSGGMAPAQFDNLVRAILKPTNGTVTTLDPVRNSLILNGTPSDIEDYKKAIRDLKLDESSNSNRITRIVKLNYADASQLSGILTAYLTPVGRIQVNGQSLVIWEVATNMGVLLELIKELDHKPAQVLIESTIVEVDSEKDLNLGINWSANKNVGDPTISGGFNGTTAAPGFFTFGTIKSGLNINANLAFLETHKKGKIISRPRIATANGVVAEINEVENVVIESDTSAIGLGGVITTTRTFTTFPLPIDLRVTPRITDDGRITTVIIASITSQSGPQLPNAPPPTNVQTATTTITTKNGETIVIGGLVRDVVQDSVDGIPLLSSIPIIGTLFQERTKTHRKEELVIFITPTLLEE